MYFLHLDFLLYNIIAFSHIREDNAFARRLRSFLSQYSFFCILSLLLLTAISSRQRSAATRVVCCARRYAGARRARRAPASAVWSALLKRSSFRACCSAESAGSAFIKCLSKDSFTANEPLLFWNISHLATTVILLFSHVFTKDVSVTSRIEYEYIAFQKADLNGIEAFILPASHHLALSAEYAFTGNEINTSGHWGF